MTVILLTVENVETLKQELRKQYADVKSAHWSEALARCLGFQTHAALLSRMKLSTHELRVLQLGALAGRLAEFGYPLSPLINISELFETTEMPDAIWRMFRRANGQFIPSHNSWFNECERREIPMIYIETQRKYGRVAWDAICLNKFYHDAPRGSDGEPVYQALKALYFRDATKKSVLMGGCFSGHIEGLPITKARRVAEEVALILYPAIFQRELAA